MIDAAAAKGVDCLKPAEEISIGDLEKALTFAKERSNLATPC